MGLNLKDYLSKIEMGEVQRYKNIAVMPLFVKDDGKIDYLTLKEAMDRKVISVNEVSEGGSVPDLVVDVSDDVNVLILDGEELMGAKQNRILNASVLLWGKSRTTVPVSCTERGRWSHVSKSFHDSENVANYAVRMAKNISVSHALRAKMGYRSDQGKVWAGISDLEMKAKVMSSTHAMRDVYENKRSELDGYLKSFELKPGQRGMLVFIDGDIAGMDIVSKGKAYRIYQDKLLRSYCIHALYNSKQDKSEPDPARAREFLERISSCRESKYKSVGRGDDYRFEGKGFTGAALEVEGEVLHMAFLSTAQSAK
jgi:hypothetical protein